MFLPWEVTLVGQVLLEGSLSREVLDSLSSLLARPVGIIALISLELRPRADLVALLAMILSSRLIWHLS